MIRTCGACTALLAFAITIFRGVLVDNPTDTILTRALWSLVVFLVLGLAVGWIGQTVIEEHSRQLHEREAIAQREAEAALATDAGEAEAAANDADPAPKPNAARAPEGAGARAG